MKLYRMILLSIAFSFISSSIAFSDEMTAWSWDHSYRIGVWDVASEQGVRDNLPDSVAFSDHSFREGVQSPEFGRELSGRVRGYYPETDMLQESGTTDDDSIHLQLIDGPAD